MHATHLTFGGLPVSGTGTKLLLQPITWLHNLLGVCLVKVTRALQHCLDVERVVPCPNLAERGVFLWRKPVPEQEGPLAKVYMQDSKDSLFHTEQVWRSMCMFRGVHITKCSYSINRV